MVAICERCKKKIGSIEVDGKKYCSDCSKIVEKLKERTPPIRFFLAFFACAAEFILYSIAGTLLLGWENGGGVIPMLILFAVMGVTWRAVINHGSIEHPRQMQERACLQKKRQKEVPAYMWKRVYIASGCIVLLVLSIFFLSKVVRKDTSIEDIELTKSMLIREVKSKLGEPDSYDDGYGYGGSILSSSLSKSYPYHIEKLCYDPFGAYNQRVGHITKYRLNLTFSNGYLLRWERSEPLLYQQGR